MRRLLLFVAAIALIGAATPAPTWTPPPTAAPSTAAPTSGLLTFTGELLDMQHGFVFFTTGDAFPIAPDAKIINYDTKQPATQAPTTRMFAQATFDGGKIVELAIAKHPLPPSASYAEIHKYAVALSPTVANPDLDPNRPRPGGTVSRIPLTGKIVQVRFVVQVPPTTPMSDAVYMSTDVSGWNPQATRMERFDALHYAVTLPLRTGTEFYYKFTRGSWQSAERGRTGIDEAPHHFFLGATALGEPDTQVRDDVVYNWADYNPAGGGQAIVPGATPTPFNPMPFGYPTPFPVRTPVPGPTSRTRSR
ncbi:MAG TPA: hypothetical protein VMD07_05015 [Candidatus Acidoferrales bacterium]|nr:hypothetical protein [Candidatus Acidoferrales bacterium]